MLVLKLNLRDKVSFYDASGREIGTAWVERHHSCGPNSVRLIADFDPTVKIYRQKVVEKSDELRANLTPRA